MSSPVTSPANIETASDIAAFKNGDERMFNELTERHRAALRVHCYRMLGSFEEAEDLTQETFLRAWRRRESFEGRSKLRSWLYSIATNVCLDAMDTFQRRPATVSMRGADGADETTTEVTWLQPFPDQLIDAADASDPESAAIERETIELAYIAAIQHLTPKSRATLILRDVLGWSAKQTADLLETSVASANSSLQRARETLREHLPEQRSEWPSGADATAAERELLERYIAASERFDRATWLELLNEQTTWSMPPELGVWIGQEPILDSWMSGGFGGPDWGEMRSLPIRANRQPGLVNYLKRPGDSEFRLLTLDMVRIVEGEVTEIMTFFGTAIDVFEFPDVLQPVK